MTDQQPQNHSEATQPPAPPTHRDPSTQRADRPAWPGVVGTIMIVLGVGSLMGGCLGLVSPWTNEFWAGLVPEAESGMYMMEGWTPYIVVASIVLTLLAALQIVGGFGLLKRRAWAVRVCITWAVLKLVVATANMVPTYLMQHEQFAAMQEEDIAGMPGQMESVMLVFLALALLLGLLWAWAMPIFTLIWLSRSKTKAEVAQWR